MQNIIFYFLLDCECLAPRFTGPRPVPSTPPTRPQPRCTVLAPTMEKDLGRAEAERADGPAQPTKALSSPRAFQGTGGLVQTILREGKARFRFCFLGELLFSFFFLSFFWNFVCWRILCDLFHKKKKKQKKEKAIIGKVRLSGVVHFRGWGGPGVGMQLLEAG